MKKTKRTRQKPKPRPDQVIQLPIGNGHTGVIRLTKEGIHRGFNQNLGHSMVRVFTPSDLIITTDEASKIYRYMRREQKKEKRFHLKSTYEAYLFPDVLCIGCWRIERAAAYRIFAMLLNKPV